MFVRLQTTASGWTLRAGHAVARGRDGIELLELWEEHYTEVYGCPPALDLVAEARGLLLTSGLVV